MKSNMGLLGIMNFRYNGPLILFQTDGWLDGRTETLIIVGLIADSTAKFWTLMGKNFIV